MRKGAQTLDGATAAGVKKVTKNKQVMHIYSLLIVSPRVGSSTGDCCAATQRVVDKSPQPLGLHLHMSQHTVTLLMHANTGQLLKSFTYSLFINIYLLLTKSV